MFLRELFSSYQPGALGRLNYVFRTFPADGCKEMVVQDPIPFTSMCAHHLLPFSGEVCVGYIPDKQLVGLSKLTRVVQFYSAKLQVQERVAAEVADYLMSSKLKPKGVAVFVRARHFCMECRGVRVIGVKTGITALRGIMEQPDVKSEFYDMLAQLRSG